MYFKKFTSRVSKSKYKVQVLTIATGYHNFAATENVPLQVSGRIDIKIEALVGHINFVKLTKEKA